MRKVTRRIGKAFLEGRADHLGNTATDGHTLTLFGNRIAWRVPGKGRLREYYVLTLADHPTYTTRERLNGLLELMGSDWRIWQEREQQILGHPDGRRVPLDRTDRIEVPPGGEPFIIPTMPSPAWT